MIAARVSLKVKEANGSRTCSAEVGDAFGDMEGSAEQGRGKKLNGFKMPEDLRFPSSAFFEGEVGRVGGSVRVPVGVLDESGKGGRSGQITVSGEGADDLGTADFSCAIELPLETN